MTNAVLEKLPASRYFLATEVVTSIRVRILLPLSVHSPTEPTAYTLV